MRTFFLTLVLAIASTALQAQEIIYEKEDSLFITGLLNRHAGKEYNTTGKLLLAIATEFTGREYVAGTLDAHDGEPLYISTSRLDCTTFVELVLAISVTIKEGDNTFAGVCSNLEKVRYCNGVRNGYASRLHYISQWIADSAKSSFIEEVTCGDESRTLLLDLHYMSRHPANYRQLKENPALVAEIEKREMPFRGKKVCYIPKESIDKNIGSPRIENGDIIALTTDIKGLDVVHIGFAYRKNGSVHLLHASSGAGKVIKDEKTLFNYQKGKKSQTGIRIFRAK